MKEKIIKIKETEFIEAFFDYLKVDNNCDIINIQFYEKNFNLNTYKKKLLELISLNKKYNKKIVSINIISKCSINKKLISKYEFSKIKKDKLNSKCDIEMYLINLENLYEDDKDIKLLKILKLMKNKKAILK
jgi:hypothetical protein